MSKLFVYGCSFSCNYVSNKELPPIEKTEAWPYIVAKNIGYEIVDRSNPGYGYNHIEKCLNEDLILDKISKEDIILIDPSEFQRATYPEIHYSLLVDDGIQDWNLLNARYGKSIEEITKINVIRFCLKIKTLRELGYKIYGWCWSLSGHTKEISDLKEHLLRLEKNIIPTPDSRLFWEDWVLDNPSCMLIPGKPLSNNSWTRDTHFSRHGHKVAAEQFVKFLST